MYLEIIKKTTNFQKLKLKNLFDLMIEKRER
jgi:hypothetical protein